MSASAGSASFDRLNGEAGTGQIGMRLGADLWLLELADVGDIIPLPQLFAVPFTQPWFAGVVALRGDLVGVVDFAAFTGMGRVDRSEDARLVLAAPKHGVNTAIMFDQEVGLQNPEYFTREQSVGALPAWVESIYRDPEQRAWRALSIPALMGERNFLAIEAAP